MKILVLYDFRTGGKIGRAFSSAGGWGGGMELACQSILTVLMNFGFLVCGVTDYVSRDMTLHYGAVSAKAPAPEQCPAACRVLGLGYRLACSVAFMLAAGRAAVRHGPAVSRQAGFRTGVAAIPTDSCVHVA